MNFKTSIRKFMEQFKQPKGSGDINYVEDASLNSENPARQNANDLDLIPGPGEGMSTGTARFVIERNLPANIAELYHLEDLKNRGRYYMAKIVRPDGSIANELLVDKQNGTVHFLRK
jgi:hypothetical protein